jgi:hypothetical protein
MSVVKLATSQSQPQKRACSTCQHREYDKCGATGFYLTIERGYPTGKGVACGHDGALWELAPPKPPRRGVLTVLRDWLVGGW